jgi:hypothetical protein
MTDNYDSTGGQRTAVGNETRFQYRTLTEDEQAQMAWLKERGQEFIDHCQELHGNTESAAKGREFALAITHMEDAVMRAVRGVTG